MTNSHHALSPNPKPPDNHPDWLNPLNRMIMRRAFQAEAKNVTINNIKLFIDYDKRPGYAWIRPENKYQFVPCGWFKLDVVTKKEWVVT